MEIVEAGGEGPGGEEGWLGKDIGSSGFNFRFKVIEAMAPYVCGEETALLNSIEGKRGGAARHPTPRRKGCS
ncbi:MAG: hypothetical protein R2810_03555 [Flavobacteriales bacterium]